MRMILAIAILVACGGCKGSNFWRAKPDNYAKRSADYNKSQNGILRPGRDRDGMGLDRDPNAGGLPVIR